MSEIKRTAILPSVGDPLLLRFWLNHYEQVWCSEVDELIVSINSSAEPAVAGYMQDLVESTKKAKLIYVPVQTDHGVAIDRALDQAGELVFLIEEDAFVLERGKVDGCFRVLERDEKDIIGSPRGSCSPEIWDYVRDFWGLMYASDGDVGPNFWPNFFFCKRGLLTETDRQFCAQAWEAGEMLPGLNMKAKGFCNGDTFVNTSLQLRAKDPRIAVVPQYHGHPEDMAKRAEGKGLWDGNCPWFHMGSLSSGVTGVLTTDDGRPLNCKHKEPKPEGWQLPSYANTEMEQIEWERRIAWWMMSLEAADDDPTDPIPDYRNEYRQALQRVIQQFGLSPSRIIRSIVGYKELLTWKI